MKKLATVVIRTFNEARYLDELLSEISKQNTNVVENEVVIVDSGSTDNTLEIAEKHNCRITHIKQSEFTFGRSLNIGCEFAKGDILVFVSGHCIPASVDWLDELCRPIVEQVAVYTYGRQMGRDTTKYSETKHFDKWFPEYSKIPQEGFFCNNANAAVSRESWEKFGFNEELTGLEDMYLAKQLVESGVKIGYVSSAPVYHIHDEPWSKLRTRYEREAYALQKIMPEVHFSFTDFLRFLISGVMSDFAAAIREKLFLKRCVEIVLFRYNHYWGTYKGNHEMRKLSAKQKFHYFYPKDVEKEFYHD
ncbi:glycosyltransferase [Paraglaciecola sp. 2405UD69-4]|uniref:glycosyltransferase n=1 Tax=Paraglaciecola sp. 2405UD69-4 TaxID=3391836 RepID=UPI0039C9A138